MTEEQETEVSEEEEEEEKESDGIPLSEECIPRNLYDYIADNALYLIGEMIDDFIKEPIIDDFMIVLTKMRNALRIWEKLNDTSAFFESVSGMMAGEEKKKTTYLDYFR